MAQGRALMPFARTPSPRARLMYSDLGMVDLGRPRNSRIMSRGSATRPTPANTMNSSHPAPPTLQIYLMVHGSLCGFVVVGRPEKQRCWSHAQTRACTSSTRTDIGAQRNHVDWEGGPDLPLLCRDAPTDAVTLSTRLSP